MKKIYSLLLMTLLAATAWAGEVSFGSDFSASNWTTVTEAQTYSMTQDGVTLTIDKGTSTTSVTQGMTQAHLRVYKNSSITLSCAQNITAVEFTVVSGYNATNFKVDGTSLTSATWTGTAKSVTFDAGAQVRLTGIKVTYEDGDQDVATPEISGESPFVGSTTVSITCATDDVEIYYTLDGSDPDDSANAYAGPFTITESCTVKAIAYDLDGNASNIASKAFAAIPAISTVAEFNALDVNTSFVFNGNGLVATAQKNNYLYAQDATGGILIYGATGQTYALGDKIPAGFTGTRIDYAGAPELSNPAGFTASTETATVEPLEVTPATASLDDFGKYVVLRGVTVSGNTLNLGQESVATFTTFASVPSDVTGKTFDVYGVIGIRNEAVQILPTEYVENEPTTEFSLTVTPVAGTYNEPITVTIATANAAEGEVAISYTLDGSDPAGSTGITYTEPFVLYKSATLKVYAIDNELNEATAEAAYVIDLPALAITASPAPGTYRAAQTVSFAVENAYDGVEGLYEVVYADETTASGEFTGDFDVEIAQSATITVEAVDGLGREFSGEFAYVIDLSPVTETVYTITFADADNDSSAAIKDADLDDFVTEGRDLISSLSDVAYVYKGKNGLKFSSSSKNGSMTINFAEAFENVTSVSVLARQWKDTEAATINGESLGAELAEMVIDTDVASLESLTLTATKRAYVKAINIYVLNSQEEVAEKTLDEVLAADSEEVVVLSSDVFVADVEDSNIYATDNNGNWVALDFAGVSVDELQAAASASGIQGGSLKGTIAGTATNPVFTVTESAVTAIDGVAEIETIDLTHRFEVKGNSMIKVVGYYQDGKITAYSGEEQGGTIGQYFTVGTDFFMGTLPEGPVVAEGIVTLNAPFDASAGAPKRIPMDDPDYFTNYTLNVTSVSVATGVEDINTTAAVASVRYYNVAGQQSEVPFNGVNIVVTEYANGTSAVSKVVR